MESGVTLRVTGRTSLRRSSTILPHDGSKEMVMKAAENRDIVRQMLRNGMELGDFDAAMAAYDPDVIYHNPVVAEMPGLPPGTEGMKMLLAGSRAAFPDMVYTIEMLVAEGDGVAVLYSWSGTHTGALATMPATGKRVSATGAIFCRLADGRIVEQWDIDDRLTVMQQLGVMPQEMVS